MKVTNKKFSLIIFCLVLLSFSVLATTVSDTNSTFTDNINLASGKYVDGLYDITPTGNMYTFNGSTLLFNSSYFNSTISSTLNVTYADNYATLQAALDAGNNDSTIILGAKNYVIGSPLRFYNNQKIIGQGIANTIIDVNSSFTGTGVIEPKYPSDTLSFVLIQGMRIDCNSIANNGIWFNTTKLAQIQFVQADSCLQYGFNIGDDSYYVDADYVRGSNNVVGDVLILDNSVTINHLRSAAPIGVNISSANGGIANHVVLNELYIDNGAGTIGVLVDRGDDVVIRDSRIEGPVTCIQINAASTDVLAEGNHYSSCTRVVNNAALTEFTDNDFSTQYFGMSNISNNGRFDFGSNFTFNGIAARIAPNSDQIGATFSFSIGNSTDTLQLYKTATSSGLQSIGTWGRSIEIKSNTGDTYLSQASDDNSLYIRSSTSNDIRLQSIISNFTISGTTSGTLLNIKDSTTDKILQFFGNGSFTGSSFLVNNKEIILSDGLLGNGSSTSPSFNNISLNYIGSYAGSNISYNGKSVYLTPGDTSELGSSMTFKAGNSTRFIEIIGAATATTLQTRGTSLEVKTGTGTTIFDNATTNNTLDIRDANSYDWLIRAETGSGSISVLNITGETNNAIITLFNDSSAKFYGTITSSSSIWLNSTGSTSLNINRAGTSSNGGLVWYTGGAQRWTFGPKSSATSDDLYLRDNGHTTDALQIVYATTPIVNITSTFRASGIFSLNNATNYNMDTFTLNASGGFNVSNTRVTTETKIICQQQTLGGTPGILGKTIVAGVGYTVQSSSTTDTSTTTCILIQPGG